MQQIVFFFALSCLFFIPAAFSQELVALPKGETLLNLSATEQIEAEQDTLVAALRFDKEHSDSKQVQQDINQAMAKAMALTEKHPSLKVETGTYYVHPDYRYIQDKENGTNKQILDKWRGSQTIIIKSEVSQDVLSVTGSLQDIGFIMNGLDYQLSPSAYEKIRDALMETTVASLKFRAERVAKALNKTNVDIVEINVDANPYMPRPIFARGAKMEMMAMAADSAMATPSASAGETTVSMTIHARAILRP